jgi:hypothetical protein
MEVTDAMQGKGLGTILLGQLAAAAGEVGLQVLDAVVLPENPGCSRRSATAASPSRPAPSPGRC